MGLRVTIFKYVKASGIVKLQHVPNYDTKQNRKRTGLLATKYTS